jgi:predicted ATPase
MLPLITELRVKGFKSIATEQRLAIRPLTILAGANSSGKSSMMQPALLIKQTLESSYDPGALSINGPNVKMTEFRQLFWGTGTQLLADSIEITLDGEETG